MLPWLVLWISGVLGHIDMKEKLFAFPVESSTSYVQIFPDHIGPFREVTICMRFHSNLTRPYPLLLWSTPSATKTVLLYYYAKQANAFLLLIYNNAQYYDVQKKDFTEWTSLCVTWNSSVWGLFIDGKYCKADNVLNEEISGDHIIIIGQGKSSHGGVFKASQSFVGEMTDINMWDKVLTDEDMMDYFADNQMSGNIINWNTLTYNLHGDVTIKPYVDPYPCVQVEL